MKKTLTWILVTAGIVGGVWFLVTKIKKPKVSVTMPNEEKK